RLEALLVLAAQPGADAGIGPRRVDGVMERAQHAGDGAPRRALDAPLAERQRGLALEVDDGEILAGVEHLAEVVVAMAADAAGGQLCRPQGGPKCGPEPPP